MFFNIMGTFFIIVVKFGLLDVLRQCNECGSVVNFYFKPGYIEFGVV